MPKDHLVTYTFDGLTLVTDIAGRPVALYRGTDLLKVGDRALEVLARLVKSTHPVSREELRSTLFGQHPSAHDSNVDHQIGWLKKALGPASELIETVRGHGWRLKASVVTEGAPLSADISAIHGQDEQISTDFNPQLTAQFATPQCPIVGAGSTHTPTPITELSPAVRSADAHNYVASPPHRLLRGEWHLGQLDKDIVARSADADHLLARLRESARIVSIVAPAGFGKTALVVRLIQTVLVGDDLKRLNSSDEERDSLVRAAGLDGILILNAEDHEREPLRRDHLITLLGQFSNRDFDYRTVADGSQTLFDRLRGAGRLWVIVENADVFNSDRITPELNSLLLDWCSGAHHVKLLLLMRFPLASPPACHETSDEGRSLADGLPPDFAVSFLRDRLRSTIFRNTDDALLREIAVTRLHCMPLAIETFAGYLADRQRSIKKLDQQFIENNNPLRLFHKQQTGRFFKALIGDQLSLLDSTSILLLRVLASTTDPVPQVALLAIESAREGDDGRLDTLHRSSLVSETRSLGHDRWFAIHALIRDALDATLGVTFERPEFIRVGQIMEACGLDAYDHSRFDVAYALFAHGQNIFRQLCQSDSNEVLFRYLAAATTNRGMVEIHRGHWANAEAHLAEAASLYRSRITSGASNLVKSHFANCLTNSAWLDTLRGRLLDAESAYSEALDLYNSLNESDHADARPALVYALSGRANILTMTGRHESAERDYISAISLCEELVISAGGIEFTVSLDQARMALGNVYIRLERLDDAERLLSQAHEHIQQAARLEHPIEVGLIPQSFLNCGNLNYVRGRFVKAEADADHAIGWYGFLISERGRQDLLGDLGLALVTRAVARAKTGKLPQPVTDDQEAFTLYAQLSLQDGQADLEARFAKTLLSCGTSDLARGILDRAEAALLSAEGYFRMLVDHHQRADLVQYLAEALLKRGELRQSRADFAGSQSDYTEAIHLFVSSFNRANDAFTMIGMATALYRRALLRLDSDLTEDARESANKDFESAMGIYQELDARTHSADIEEKQAHFFLKRANAARRLVSLKDADHDFGEARSRYLKIATERTTWDVEEHLAEAIIGASLVKLGMEQFDQAEELCEFSMKRYSHLLREDNRNSLQPWVFAVVLVRARLRLTQERHEEGEADAQLVIERIRRRKSDDVALDSKLAEALTIRGMFRITSHGFEEAEHDLEEAYRIHCKHVGLERHSLAVAYCHLMEEIKYKHLWLEMRNASRTISLVNECLARQPSIFQELLNDLMNYQIRLNERINSVAEGTFNPETGRYPDPVLRQLIYERLQTGNLMGIASTLTKSLFEDDMLTPEQYQTVVDCFTTA